MGHGEILNLLLKHKKMTVATLSKKSGIPQPTLYALRQRNTRGNSHEILKKICDVLNAPLALFTEYSDTQITEYFFLRSLSNKRNFDDEDRAMFTSMFEQDGTDIKYLSKLLRLMGETHYTEEYLQDVFNGKIEIQTDDIVFMCELLDKEFLITRNEYKMIKKYRTLSNDQKKALDTMMKACLDRNDYFRKLYCSAEEEK